MCHLEHYDSWQMTLHAAMMQDAQKNRDVIVTRLDARIRAELAKFGDKLKVPVDKIYIPKMEDIKYTIGRQWTQGILVEKNGNLRLRPFDTTWNPTAG